MSQTEKRLNCEICNLKLTGKQKFTCSDKCRKIRKSNYDQIRNEGLAEHNVIRVREYRKGRGSERWAKEKENIKNNPMKYYYKTIMTLLRKYLKSGKNPKYSKTIAWLPFGYNDLVNNLKCNIPDGFTWDDYLSGKLHLDHKRPHSLFNYFSHECEDFKLCWSINNLQLLDKQINITKQNRYEH